MNRWLVRVAFVLTAAPTFCLMLWVMQGFVLLSLVFFAIALVALVGYGQEAVTKAWDEHLALPLANPWVDRELTIMVK